MSLNPHPSRRNMSVGNHIHPLCNSITTMLTLLAQKILSPSLVLETSYHKGWSEENRLGTEKMALYI